MQHEDAGTPPSERLVTALTQSVKHIQDEVQHSESLLKLAFQKAYKAGKKRHDALVKRSNALKQNRESAQLHEERLKTELAKVRATGKTLKHKIQVIRGILSGSTSPIDVPHELSEE